MEMDLDDYRDLHKKYSQTYIRARQKGASTYSTYYVNQISVDDDPDEDSSFIVYGRDNEERDVSLSSQSWDFDFSFPPIGVVQFKNTVVIANKFPARQWKKAVNLDNFKIYIPLLSLIQKLDKVWTLPRSFIRSFNWTVAEIDLLYNASYSTYEEAKVLLSNNKYHAVAISKQFFLTNSFYGKGFLIWRFNAIIAEDDGEINYLLPNFKQELLDFFNRNKYARD